jgi:hypothetical protein
MLEAPPTRRPGRPTKAEVLARPPATPTQIIPVIVRDGVICPICGRGATMKSCTRQQYGTLTIIVGTCGACGRRLRREMNGATDLIQRI